MRIEKSWVAVAASLAIVASAALARGVANPKDDQPMKAAPPKDVPTDPQSKFLVKLVRRCGTSAPDNHRRSALRLRTAPFAKANLRAMATGPITVPVYFHVIQSGATGAVTNDRIAQQIQVLNDDYATRGFKFVLQATTRTDVADPSVNKPGWFSMATGSSDEIEAKSTLAVDPTRNLNLYTAEPSDPVLGGLLGFSTFPWELAGNIKKDGVVILHATLPGGVSPFDKGKTATHEVGHWLGLYHTFQGGCTPPGDEVDDTQEQPDGNNIFQCDPATNVCPGGDPAKAPIHNFMNYVEDACMNNFTPGQSDRMKVEVSLYRALLVHPTTRANLKTFASAR